MGEGKEGSKRAPLYKKGRKKERGGKGEGQGKEEEEKEQNPFSSTSSFLPFFRACSTHRRQLRSKSVSSPFCSSLPFPSDLCLACCNS
jgi:hypothetical protein